LRSIEKPSAIKESHQEIKGWSLDYDVTDMARAAIEAMREPTKAVIEAGYKVETFGDGVSDPASVWPAMIDAVLSE
jgi:hypothetical protein